jgi:integrase
MIGCEPFSPEQEKQLRDYFKSRRHSARNVALLTFGIQTGFRISEILSLTIGELFKGGKMVDRVYMRKWNMKGGKAGKSSGRSMILAKNTKKALQAQVDYLAGRGRTEPEQFIFQTQNFKRGNNQHMHYTSGWRLLNYAAKELGMTIKVGSHSMRKTFADRIYRNLLDKKNADALRILQAGLGHENINNTIRYLSFQEDDLNTAIDDVFGG